MFHFLLRRIPRFGFLTLFAAMLLCVSAAGWFKFQYDLYQEEEALLADLAKAGVDFGYERYSGASPDRRGVAQPIVPPQLDRIRLLIVTSYEPPHRSLIDRAARLPHVLEFRAIPQAAPPAATRTVEASFGDIGVELPPLPPRTFGDEPSLLQTGTRLDEAESIATLDSWKAAWRAPRRTPDVALVRVAYPPEMSGLAEVRHEDGFVIAHRGTLQFFDRDRLSYIDEPTAPIETDRSRESDVLDYLAEQGPRFLSSSTARHVLEKELEVLFVDDAFHRYVDANGDSSVGSISRIDEARYRIDFEPMTAEFSEQGLTDEVRLSAVFRSDLDHAVEAFDLFVQRRALPSSTVPMEPVDASFAWRGVSRRVGDFVLLEETVGNLPGRGRPISPLTARASSFVAAYDVEAPLDADRFSPKAFGVVEFPPPRELPWLRWYRVACALAIGLLVFVVVRNARDWMRRRRETLEQAAPTTASAP